MKTENLRIITNLDEIEQADTLNLSKVTPKHIKTKLLFYKHDILRTWVNEDGDIVIVTIDGSYFVMGYEETIWNKLEKYFQKNEK